MWLSGQNALITRTFGVAAVGELNLSQIARGAKFAQVLAEDHSFVHNRQDARLFLTNDAMARL